MNGLFKKYFLVLAFLPCQMFLAFGYLRWEGAYELPHLAWFFSDDFFYYIKVAQSILQTGIPSFDGTTATNGYHPLWMWVMLLLAVPCGGFGDAFFAALRILIVLINVASGVLLWRLCLGLFSNRWIRCAVFIFHYYIICKLGFLGMEFTLVVPMMLLLVLGILSPRPWARNKWIGLGLLGGFIMLARIDTLVLIVPLFLILAWQSGDAPQRRWCLIALGIGLTPFCFYVAHNYTHFGTLLPVSGMAKQLKTSLLPSPTLLRSLLVPVMINHFFQRLLPLLCALAGLCAALAALAVDRDNRRAPTLAPVFSPAALWLVLFPFVYYAILMVRYDWPIDDWYTYPLPQASVIGLALVDRTLASRRWYATALPGIGVLGLLLALTQCSVSLVRIASLTPSASPCYWSALELRDFARANPGIIGMGDRAGLAAFINPSPIVQLEGLMSDARMLEHIRNQDDILEVLREYGATYYAACQDLPKTQDGYATVEPVRPGPLARKMKGVFPAEPLLREHYPSGTTLWVFRVPKAANP